GGGGGRSRGGLWCPPPPTPSPIRSGGHDRPASGAATGRIPAPVAGRAHVRAARAASLSRSWGRFCRLLFWGRSYWGGSVLRVGFLVRRQTNPRCEPGGSCVCVSPAVLSSACSVSPPSPPASARPVSIRRALPARP